MKLHTLDKSTEAIEADNCSLATGRTGIMIAAAPGTADTPRAHITNMAGLGKKFQPQSPSESLPRSPGHTDKTTHLTPPECLRDIGLEDACLDLATVNENMAHSRWCHTMAGDEYARIYSWGNDPKRKVPTVP